MPGPFDHCQGNDRDAYEEWATDGRTKKADKPTPSRVEAPDDDSGRIIDDALKAGGPKSTAKK